MTLKVSGLSKVLTKARNFNKLISDPNPILNKFSEIAVEEITEAHKGVLGLDFTNDGTIISVYSDIKVTVDVGNGSQSVVGRGENFLFHEFGAGIQHNSPRDWATVMNTPIPSGIAPIGSYKGGMGSNMYWKYGIGRTTVTTGGYPARHGFANAINEVVANKDKIIREALNEKR